MEETHPDTPEKFLLDESFDKINYILKWLGLPQGKKKEAESFTFYYLNFILLNLLVFGAICWFVEGARRGESLTSLTYVAPCFTLSIMTDIKTICLIVYRDPLHNMITALKTLETKENQQPRAVEKDEIITKEITFIYLVLKVLYIINWFLIISFCTMPLVLMILNYMKSKEINLLLPLLILYPFDEFNIIVYPFVYLNQSWSVVTVVLQVFCVDAIFYISCTHIKMHFQLLGYELQQIVDTRGSGALFDDPDFKSRFEELMKRHQIIMYSVDQLEVVYSKSTLFNFVTSSALICLTGFNVTTLEDVAFVISFISFLFITLLQIFFLCFFGEMIMNASVDISHAIYNSEWYMADAKSAKMLYIVLMRSQRPCRLTAFGFADVNLRAFMKILSTAWSYFALLQTVYTTDEEN